jgi:hypothetical protein
MSFIGECSSLVLNRKFCSNSSTELLERNGRIISTEDINNDFTYLWLKITMNNTLKMAESNYA